MLPGCFHTPCYDHCLCCWYSDTIFGTDQVPKMNTGVNVFDEQERSEYTGATGKTQKCGT